MEKKEFLRNRERISDARIKMREARETLAHEIIEHLVATDHQVLISENCVQITGPKLNQALSGDYIKSLTDLDEREWNTPNMKHRNT